MRDRGTRDGGSWDGPSRASSGELGHDVSVGTQGSRRRSTERTEPDCAGQPAVPRCGRPTIRTSGSATFEDVAARSELPRERDRADRGPLERRCSPPSGPHTTRVDRARLYTLPRLRRGSPSPLSAPSHRAARRAEPATPDLDGAEAELVKAPRTRVGEDGRATDSSPSAGDPTRRRRRTRRSSGGRTTSVPGEVGWSSRSRSTSRRSPS